MTSSAERQMKLLLFIKEHAPVSREAIFRELHEYNVDENTDSATYKKSLETMRRKFMRDKKELEECGFYIKCDDEDRYSVDAAASYTIPLNLSDVQASLLRYACCALLEDPSYLFKDELRMALIKISDELDAPDMLPFFDKNTSPLSNKANADFSKIISAIAKHKIISFEYMDAKGASSKREVEPLGAYALEKYFYLIAFDRKRSGQRCFRFDRMKKVRELNSGKNPDFEAQDFNVSDWIKLPFQIGEDEFEAEIHFDQNVAWKAKRLVKRYGSLEELDDESCIWTVKANSADALASWCIANGSGIVPLQPQSARDAYKQSLQKVLEQTL